jgi:hypothetical protein
MKLRDAATKHRRIGEPPSSGNSSDKTKESTYKGLTSG